ncbi:MAG: hypothetical protein GY772_23930 [bacterium]|nr:hypothetical protein [bacterium]
MSHPDKPLLQAVLANAQVIRDDRSERRELPQNAGHGLFDNKEDLPHHHDPA